MAHRPARDHLDVAREAGLGRVSLISLLAGVLTAYGLFAIAAALAGAVASALDADTDFRTNDWTSSGAAAAVIAAAVLFGSYVFGGYVTGRMARRAGLLHGVALFVLTLVIGVVVGATVSGLADDGEIDRNLRSIGVPTSTDQITGVAVGSALISLAAILLGAMLGGTLGERWHAKLARRAADPAFGPAAEARALAEREDQERDERIARDPVVARDVDHRSSEAASQDVVDLTRAHQGDEPRYTATEWQQLHQDDARRF